jgi:hypothetical protein
MGLFLPDRLHRPAYVGQRTGKSLGIFLSHAG